ncbi:hypothetical protein DEO72_LG3g394 [Vigna unguiculata]|uniref:Uncharacterized protein n=1 Tax=Vigna unguiculata TaxID=3917 RepID=A0A4D6LBK6_VIGUN|nr:hypothetical protein DEO72_LG3g394 [Vigna unguiculata]
MPVVTATITKNFTGDHASLSSFVRETLSPLPRATTIPGADAAAASPTAGETRRRRHQPPTEASSARTQLRESSPFSFLSRARDRPDPGAPPSHTMPLQSHVRQLRPPRPGLPPRRHCRSQRVLTEMPAAVTFLCSKLRPAGGDIFPPSRGFSVSDWRYVVGKALEFGVGVEGGSRFGVNGDCRDVNLLLSVWVLVFGFLLSLAFVVGVLW